MIHSLAKLLSYGFIVRALAVGALVSLCSALLGVTLVLKRYSMIGDGLSHVGFGTLAVAMSLGLAPLKVSLPLVLLAAFLLLRVSERSTIKGDAAIAMISSSALAVGIVVISLSGVNADVSSYMFGTILAVSEEDLQLSILVSVVVLALYVLFYHKIFSITFDESFAKATGTNTEIYNLLIASLTAIVIVVGMRLMGAMLISSLIIFPALTAMRIFGSFRRVVLWAAGLSVLCFAVGIFLSFLLSTPAGASVVLVNLAMFCLFCGIGQLKKRVRT